MSCDSIGSGDGSQQCDALDDIRFAPTDFEGAVLVAGRTPTQRVAPGRGYFCFQLPPASWYHQPARALSIHCFANVSRICCSHSG